MIHLLLMLTFFVSAFLVVYHHLLFPLWMSRYRLNHPIPEAPDPARGYMPDQRDHELPTVTLIIPAYNESAVITDKVNNLGMLDYPADRLQIQIICDGCQDDTAARARRAHQTPENAHLQLQVIERPDNQGKVARLNVAIDSSRSDLIALSDASALVSADALLLAAYHFFNPEVAVVAGSYHLLNPGSEGEKLYWRYQSNIKKGEAALGSPLGVHGAFYLFRRPLFQPLEADTINDDFILPMRMVARGFKAIYEPGIAALELEQASTEQDHSRRRRIAAGNLQQALRLRQLLRPRFAGIALAFASGKALRVLMPLCLLLLLISSLLLADVHILFAAAGMLQTTGYLLVFCVHRSKKLQRSRALQALYYLVSGYCTALLGTFHYLRGQSGMLWQQSVEAKENLS